MKNKETGKEKEKRTYDELHYHDILCSLIYCFFSVGTLIFSLSLAAYHETIVNSTYITEYVCFNKKHQRVS